MAISNMLAGSAASLEDAARDLYYYMVGESNGGGAWNDEVGSSYAEYAACIFNQVKNLSDDGDSVRRIEGSIHSFDERKAAAMLEKIKRSVNGI